MRQAVSQAPSILHILKLDEQLFPTEVLEPVYEWLGETIGTQIGVKTKQALLTAYADQILAVFDSQSRKLFFPSPTKAHLAHWLSVTMRSVSIARLKAEWLFLKTFWTITHAVTTIFPAAVLGTVMGLATGLLIGAIEIVVFSLLALLLGVATPALLIAGGISAILLVLTYLSRNKLIQLEIAFRAFFHRLMQQSNATMNRWEAQVFNIGPLSFGLPIVEKNLRIEQRWLENNLSFADYQTEESREAWMQVLQGTTPSSEKLKNLLAQAHQKLWQERTVKSHPAALHYFSHYAPAFIGTEAGQALRTMQAQRITRLYWGVCDREAFGTLTTNDQRSLNIATQLPSICRTPSEKATWFRNRLLLSNDNWEPKVQRAATFLSLLNRLSAKELKQFLSPLTPTEELRTEHLREHPLFLEALQKIEPETLALGSAENEVFKKVLKTILNYLSPKQLQTVASFWTAMELFEHFETFQEMLPFSSKLPGFFTVDQRQEIQRHLSWYAPDQKAIGPIKTEMENLSQKIDEFEQQLKTPAADLKALSETCLGLETSVNGWIEQGEITQNFALLKSKLNFIAAALPERAREWQELEVNFVELNKQRMQLVDKFGQARTRLAAKKAQAAPQQPGDAEDKLQEVYGYLRFTNRDLQPYDWASIIDDLKITSLDKLPSQGRNAEADRAWVLRQLRNIGL